MSGVFKTIRHEFMEMLPPTIFFLVALHIVAVIRALMVRSSGIELEASASILLAALILGKAVLIANIIADLAYAILDPRTRQTEA